MPAEALPAQVSAHCHAFPPGGETNITAANTKLAKVPAMSSFAR